MWWRRLREWLGVPTGQQAGQGGWLAGWLGDAGERLAARQLQSLGYRIVARRYRTPLGEIDLVARDGNCLVFVEVKTRRGIGTGSPAEAVDRAKQQQLTRLALAFLKQHRLLEQQSRFDVVSIIWPEGGSPPSITHIPNAFQAHGLGQMYS